MDTCRVVSDVPVVAGPWGLDQGLDAPHGLAARGNPPAERAGPFFRPRRLARANRATTANFHVWLPAQLYTPLFSTGPGFQTSLVSMLMGGEVKLQ